MLRTPEKFTIYGMETENFFHSVNQKNFPTPNPDVLLQTLVFYSKSFYFTPNPGILLQTLVFYSKSFYFNANPGILSKLCSILLQTLVL